MIVLDASAAVELLAGSVAGLRVRDALGDEQVHTPEVFHLEVTQALRRLTRMGLLSSGRAAAAVEDLEGLPILPHAHRPILPRVWELRDRCSAYDAAYVALAEALAAPLLTADARLAGAAVGLVEVAAVDV